MLPDDVVLITGINGFIGSTLANHLVGQCRVVGFDRDEPNHKIPGVHYISVDLSSREDLERGFKEVRAKHGMRLSSVIHLAAYYSFSGEESPKYQQITVDGTNRLLTELNRDFATEQFIFSSTMLVHSSARLGEEITEASPVEPTWPYPRSKVEAEQVIANKRRTIPVVNLRIAGVYDDYCHSPPLSQHIARIYERQISSLLFPGELDHGQAFLHLHDLVEAISLLIEKRAQLPSDVTLLLGEDKAISYRVLQEKIGELLHGRPWPVFRIPKLVAKIGAFGLQKMPFAREPFIKPWMIEYADDHYDLDITFVKRLLNWEPKRTLLETLPMMIASLKVDPTKWYKEHKIKEPPLRPVEEIGDERREDLFRAAAFINILLGIWLVSNPFTIGEINQLEFLNDFLTGLFITGVAALTLASSLRWLRWVNCLAAVWLMFSPLVLWTKSAAVYSNNTLLAGLILLASAYTPPRTSDVESVPNGWTYNPSGWGQRLPIITLAFFGFLLARYLAAFQLGHIAEVWDPFFGQGTATILRSDVSQAFPISDAGLGALSYLLDVISASIGDQNRWRTMPWMVILFGLLIIPTGVTSVVLVMLQPIAVGTWCTICLLAALIMLLMVPPAIDEVVASIQFLRKSVHSGQPFWRTFWLGDLRPETNVFIPKPHKAAYAWHLLITAVLGAWLLFSPWLFAFQGLAANNIYIVAALVITFAVISLAQAARILRFANVALGLWLCASIEIFDGAPTLAQWHSAFVGILIAVFSLPRGKIIEHFGTFDPWVRWTVTR